MRTFCNPFVLELSSARKNVEIPSGKVVGQIKITNCFLSHLCSYQSGESSDDVNIVCLLFPKTSGLSPMLLKSNCESQPQRVLNLALNLPIAVNLLKGSGPVYLTGFIECQRMKNDEKSKLETSGSDTGEKSSTEAQQRCAKKFVRATLGPGKNEPVSPFVSCKLGSSMKESTKIVSRDDDSAKEGDENEESDSELSNSEFYDICCDYAKKQLQEAKKRSYQLKYDMGTMKQLLKKRKDEKNLPRTIQALVRLSKVQFRTNNKRVVDELWDYVSSLK